MVSDLATEVIAPEKRRPGRPSLYTPEIGRAIIDAVRSGLSQSRASAKAGFAHTTVADWAVQFPEFASRLAQAEAEWVADRVADLQACKNNNGTCDPKAQELLLRRIPEFRAVQEIEQRTTSLSLTMTVSADQLAGLQAMRVASLERLNAVSISDKVAGNLSDSGQQNTNATSNA